MKYFLILSTLIVANLFADDHENPETGWSFEQSQLQMFYYITLEIDGEPAEGVEYGTSFCEDNFGSCDVVGAFVDRGDGNGEICVGWQYATPTTSEARLMGDDGGDYSAGYLLGGEVPYLKVYDSSNGSILDITPGSDLPGFTNNTFPLIDGTSTANNTFGCTDAAACNYDPGATADNGSCALNDCTGECGGLAVVDDCNVCDGGNADMDCAGECGGSAVEDCSGDCNGILEIDDCGVCGGDNLDDDGCSCSGNGTDDCGVCDGGNADDLGCGCFEPVPSGCDNQCGSTLENDECGECGGNCNSSCDICGVCDGDGTGCAEPTWRLQVKAEIDSYDQFQFSGNADWLLHDDENYLGVAGNATWGYDYMHDAPEPPEGPGDYIKLFFDHPEWGVWVTHFTEDIVKDDHDFFSSNLTEWKVRVQSDVPGSTVIRFHVQDDIFGSVPDNYEMYVELDGNYTSIAHEGETAVGFYMDGSGQKNFSVYIGNIPPQAPDNLIAFPQYKEIDLEWDWDDYDDDLTDQEVINDIGNRYPATSYNVYRDDEPFDPDSNNPSDPDNIANDYYNYPGNGPGGCGGLLTGEGQDDTGYGDHANLYDNFSEEGLLQESTYTYTVTGSNSAGESSEGHEVRQSGGEPTFYVGRDSRVTATTGLNDDPTSNPSYLDSPNGTNLSAGLYRIPHNNDNDENRIVVRINADQSYDSDFPYEDAWLFHYKWNKTAGGDDLQNLWGEDTHTLSFTVGNLHSTSTEDYVSGEHNGDKSYTWNLNTESEHPVKNSGACGVWTTEMHSHFDDSLITVTIEPEPNENPTAPWAFDLIRGSDQTSVVNSNDWDDSDFNDFDLSASRWYEPHNNSGDQNDADLWFTAYDSDDFDGMCDGDGPPMCVLDCPDLDVMFEETAEADETGGDANEVFCLWFINTAAPSGCFDDDDSPCEGSMAIEIEELTAGCTTCLADSEIDCGTVFDHECEDGYLEDCSEDGDCCPAEWVGDGYSDCEDQFSGCDLTCYADSDGTLCEDPTGSCNDGGDCFGGGSNCPPGYVEDCADEFQCWPGDWVDDDENICDDGSNGVDLTCYPDEANDCGGAANCAGTYCGAFLEEYTCQELIGYGYNCDLCEAEGSCDAPVEGCADSQWDCGDGQCIPGDYVCDGSDEFCNAAWPADCANGADEGLESCGYEDGCDGEGCYFDFTEYGAADCDAAWDQFGLNCEDLEAGYGWDCLGCSCPGDGDDNADGGCPEGQLEDCSGDGDCAPESWIGDGYCDGEDQAWGYDLTCYGNDGGDCDTARSDGLQRIEKAGLSNHALDQAYLDRKIAVSEGGNVPNKRHGEVISNRSAENQCDELTYEWSILEASLAGFDFVDEDCDGCTDDYFDLGVDLFTLNGSDIVYDSADLGNYVAIVDADDPGSCENCPWGIYKGNNGEDVGAYGHNGIDLHIERPNSTYILTLVVTDVYGDSDVSSLLFIVEDERNVGPTVGDLREQELYYISYGKDTRQTAIGGADCPADDLNAADTDNDDLDFEWDYTYADAGTGGDALMYNDGSDDSHYDHLYQDLAELDNDADDGDNGGWRSVAYLLAEGDHTFTFTATDPYSASSTTNTTIKVRREPDAVAASVSVVREDLKYVTVSVSDNSYNPFPADACYGDVYDGDLDNTRTIELYNDGNLIETFRQTGAGGADDDEWVADSHTAGESILIQIDKDLDAETTYLYTVQSYNDDHEVGAVDETSSASATTGNRPRVTVDTPNGAEIRSIDDLYDVDFTTAGNCGATDQNCQEYIAQIEVFYVRDASAHADKTEDDCDVYWFADENGDGSNAGCYALEDGTDNGDNGEAGSKQTIDSAVNDGLGYAPGNTGDNFDISDNTGEEVNYQARVLVRVHDIGNYDGDGAEYHEDMSDSPFTMAAHTLTKDLSSGWHLVGPPLVPYVVNLKDNFYDSFGAWGENWVAYDVTGTYDGLNLNLGEGYYLALAQNDTLIQIGDPVIADPDCANCEDYSFALADISLDKGWNLIANPLVNKVSKETFTLNYNDEALEFNDAVDAGWIAPTIYGWFENSYESIERIMPFGGYFVNTSRSLTLKVRPHLFEDNELTRKAEDLVTSKLELRARDISGEGTSDFITVGLSENANDEFVYGEDEYDLPRQAYTSMGGEFIDLKVGSDLMKDIRSIEYDDYQAWTISIESEKVDNDIELSWGDVSGFEDDLHIVVNGEAVNMHEENYIELTSMIEEVAIVVGNVDSYLNPIPEEFGLSAAYPNPFNPTTNLGLALNADGFVSMSVFNIRGQSVEVLVDRNMKAGYHNITWNADGISSGMYFVRVETGANTAMQKLMLLK